MPRFFIDRTCVGENVIEASGPDVHHITRVLRMSRGDGLVFCDGQGTDYHGVIEDLLPDRLIARILRTEPNRTEPSVFCTLYQALPKGDKMETVIQKAVELGVSEVVPVISARCVVKLKGSDGAKKAARWQLIALEAAKQSGRGIIPRVYEPVGLAEAVKAMGKSGGKCAVLYEEERETDLASFLGEPFSGKYSFMVGPEGGFEPEEIGTAREAGVQPVSLGPRILRTETASGCFLSALMFATGNLTSKE